MSTELPPCNQEDSTNCWWDATTMGNGLGNSFVSVNDENVFVTVDSNHFIQSVTLSDDGTMATVVLGDYWTAPTPEQPYEPPAITTYARFSAPTSSPSPEPSQTAGPQTPIQVQPTPVATPTETENYVPTAPPVSPVQTTESTVVPVTPPTGRELAATGLDDLNPLTVIFAVVVMAAGLGLMRLGRNRH